MINFFINKSTFIINMLRGVTQYMKKLLKWELVKSDILKKFMCNLYTMSILHCYVTQCEIISNWHEGNQFIHVFRVKRFTTCSVIGLPFLFSYLYCTVFQQNCHAGSKSREYLS